jgi:hypothetical protein
MHELPDIEQWADRATDEHLPLGFLPDQMRQCAERRKAMRDFNLNHGSQSDLMARWLLKDQPH